MNEMKGCFGERPSKVSIGCFRRLDQICEQSERESYFVVAAIVLVLVSYLQSEDEIDSPVHVQQNPINVLFSISDLWSRPVVLTLRCLKWS